MPVELHARSAFSFLEGASSPEDLAAEAARLGLEAVALLDAGGVYGAPRFFRAARERGVRPLVGARLPLAGGGWLPVLAGSRAGYRNLCQVLTTAAFRGEKGRAPVAWEDLEGRTAGLVALGGGEDGPLAAAWRSGGPPKLAAVLDRLRAVFPRDGFFLEIQRHFRREEAAWHRVLREVRQDRGLPMVATGGVIAARRGDRLVADVFSALRHHRTLDAAGRLLEANGERRLRSPEETAALFEDCPGYVEEARRLAGRLTFDLGDLGYEFPSFPVPPGETMESHLRALVGAG
ncbi:MAG: PHP domain-containing protein, partial [Puniceicoccaceae bacterium]